MLTKKFISLSLASFLTSTSAWAVGFELKPILEYNSTKTPHLVLQAASQQVISEERDDLKSLIPSAEITFAHIVNKTPYDVTVEKYTVGSEKSRFFSRAVDNAEPLAHIPVSAKISTSDNDGDTKKTASLPIHTGGYIMISGEINIFALSNSGAKKITFRTRDQMLEKLIPSDEDYNEWTKKWSRTLTGPDYAPKRTSPEDVDNWVKSLRALPENTLFIYDNPMIL